MRFRRVLALLLIALLPSSAVADWPAQGRRVVAMNSINLTYGAWIFDLPNGDLVLRAVSIGGNSYGFSTQRVTPFGEIAQGWPSEGPSFGNIGMPMKARSVGFTVDPNGFVWQAGRTISGGIGASAVTPAGLLTPVGAPWPLTTTFYSFTASAFAPAPGGIYACFSNRVQRFLESGTKAPAWPADGVQAFTSFGDLAALPDGSGGVVVMAPATSLGPLTSHFDSSGVRYGARRLSDDEADVFPYYIDLAPLPGLLHSGASHYFAVWSGPPNLAVRNVKVQRVGYNGSLAPGWPEAGMVAVTPRTIFHVTPLEDRSGGLYLVWYQDDGLPRATHILADGSFAPGSDANGVILFPPGPLREPQEGFGGGLPPYMVADVTPDGRLLFAWDDLASGNGIRVRWLLPDLTGDPSEPDEGRLILPNPQKTWIRAVHAAADGGAYVAWESADGPPGQPVVVEIWMTRLLPTSLVAVAPRVSTLRLSAPRPNPARAAVALDLTLPDDSPARVELLDVAGRVLRSRRVEEAGPHLVTFDGLASLAPGLYFARATSRVGSTAVRVVVSR